MKDELKIIMDLMEQLQDEMKYSEDDLGERLGREKPKREVDVLKVEGEIPEEMDEMSMDEEEPSSPEDDLKRRLLKLRG